MTGLPRLRPALELLGDALWVRPAGAVVVALVLGVALPEAEASPDTPLVYGADADAARSTLQSIIAATLTVTATVFGFIIVALQVAATQFSPRSLRTFVRDRGTQNSLAIFLGVVAYCLAVLLRTSDGRDEAPAIAMTLAVALILLVVCTLAFLIHHTAQSIRIERLMESITEDTLATIGHVEGDVDEEAEGTSAVPPTPASASEVMARSSGYIEEIDADALDDLARRLDVVIGLRHRVGDHCIAHLCLAWAWRRGGGTVDEPTLAQVVEGVAEAVSIGVERTMEQDVAFGPRQLVDIALRAISPAINDPRTAVEATKHLSRILCVLSDRPLLPHVRCDGAGEVRVIVPRPGFEEYLSLACDEIRRFGAGEPTVCSALLMLLEQVALGGASEERGEAIGRHVDAIEESARREIGLPSDLAQVRDQARSVRGILAGERPGRWEAMLP